MTHLQFNWVDGVYKQWKTKRKITWSIYTHERVLFGVYTDQVKLQTNNVATYDLNNPNCSE